jgi:hypothetical protein
VQFEDAICNDDSSPLYCSHTTAIMQLENYIPNAAAFIVVGKLNYIQAQNILMLYDFMGNVMKIEIQ